MPPSPLSILIGNLLDNAIKFSRKGGEVRVIVLARRDHLLLHVIDSGPGISAADRASVFDRFYRPVGESGSGAGVGLSIVRRICDLYDAEIELLDAENGSGLLVELRFRRSI